ncbi:LiaI-LiaF-like domain-containing protein [Coralloluteibacterium thermophilus]|uniref:LiaI-LiaF-like domain-containing protein n=1 Tax=Coralloluteibacterium thermophilum TaxID=2707049 RepID=A0ABV9NJL7_9GAMM
MKFSVPAVILIVLGVVLLMNNLGLADFDLGRLIMRWWPAILIAVGISMLFRRGNPR